MSKSDTDRSPGGAEPEDSGAKSEGSRPVRQPAGYAYQVKRYNAMSIDRDVLGVIASRYLAMPEHPGVVTLRDYQFAESPYQIVFDYHRAQRMDAISLPVEESEAWALILSLAESMGHAHKHGVVHCSIHPGNLILEDAPKEDADADSQRQRIVCVEGFCNGLIGDFHHFELNESCYFGAPEQLSCMGGIYGDGRAERWDVYSFGVVAFWLLHGRLPRGGAYHRQYHEQVQAAEGRPVAIDAGALASTMAEEREVEWDPAIGTGRNEKAYRELIESCLQLDPLKRPIDMREVHQMFCDLVKEFQILDTVDRAAEAIQDAESRVTTEKKRQKGKLITARASATILAASFFVACYFLYDYFEKTRETRSKLVELDQEIANHKAHISILGERVRSTEGELAESRRAADESFYTMTQSVAGTKDAKALNKRLEKSKAYYLDILKEVSETTGADDETGRALHSLAHIEQRLGQHDIAKGHFQDATNALERALEDDKFAGDTEVYQDALLRLADSYESMADLCAIPDGVEAIASLKRAADYFKTVLKSEPEDVVSASRLSGIGFRLGLALVQHERYEDALDSYTEAATQLVGLRAQAPSTDSNESLRYCREIAQLQYYAGLALEKLDRGPEATRSYLAAIESVEDLKGHDVESPALTLLLARCFLHIGHNFDDLEGVDGGDRGQVYNEALRLISPLQEEIPGSVEIAEVHSRVLAELALMEAPRILGSKGSYHLSKESVLTLVTALDENKDHLEGHLFLAEARLKHLRNLDGKDTDARYVSLKGVEVAAHARKLFLDSADGMCAPKRKRIHLQLRDIFLAYGEICTELGQEDAASDCAEFASFTLTSNE